MNCTHFEPPTLFKLSLTGVVSMTVAAVVMIAAATWREGGNERGSA